MSSFLSDEGEQEVADVLAYIANESSVLEERIGETSEGLDTLLESSTLFLAERGISIDASADDIAEDEEIDVVVIPTWDQLLAEAHMEVGMGHSLDELFTKRELAEQDRVVRDLNDAYKEVHRLDKTDMAICVSAGLIAAAVDLIFVGVPHRGPEGLEARPLGDYVRKHFENAFPPEEMEKLASLPGAKVPYDAPYNTNFTTVDVEGLWPTMHRLYSLGHDPLLGFAVGVHDILTGQMTTIDKNGVFVVQKIERYVGREECAVFAAICKQVLHFKTDINTSMGLPAPLMGLFNLLQFGNIGEDNLTIAEIVQGMYYEGYDFIHFCAQTIPVIIAEVIVRLLYFAKRVHEGCSPKDSIPFSTNRDSHPKLATMLFIAHSIATAVDAGRVLFTKNPMEISYPQWVMFATYSFKQAKWVLISKPQAQHQYVMQSIDDELQAVIEEIDRSFDSLADEYRVVSL